MNALRAWTGHQKPWGELLFGGAHLESPSLIISSDAGGESCSRCLRKQYRLGRNRGHLRFRMEHACVLSLRSSLQTSELSTRELRHVSQIRDLHPKTPSTPSASPPEALGSSTQTTVAVQSAGTGQSQKYTNLRRGKQRKKRNQGSNAVFPFSGATALKTGSAGECKGGVHSDKGRCRYQASYKTVCTYTSINSDMHNYIHILYTYAHEQPCVYIYMHTVMYVCMYVCTYVRTYVYMYV